MFHKTSIYALNKKDPDAIVYPSAAGKPVRITREDFASEAEFLAFKAWSDEDFHREEISTTGKPTTVSLQNPCPMRL